MSVMRGFKAALDDVGDEEQALQIVVCQFAPVFGRLVDEVLAEIIPDLVHAQDGRGLSESAVRYVSENYHACDLACRVLTPEICRLTPWMSYDQSTDGLCWYATAVAATLGLVEIKSLEPGS